MEFNQRKSLLAIVIGLLAIFTAKKLVNKKPNKKSLLFFLFGALSGIMAARYMKKN